MSTGSGRDAYFYLSHARAPSVVIDHWVRTFYDHLSEAVRDLARRGHEMEIGFGDFIPPGRERDAEIDRAVSAARVFVPLYSPEYVDAPPPDRALFLDRLRTAGTVKSGTIQPVLWAPLPPGRTFPDLASALELGADLEDYAWYGLSAMCRLRAHADGYRLIVRRLAGRIVEAAEFPTPIAGAMPQAVELPAEPYAEVSFIVAVIALTEGRLPPGRKATCYGSRSITWRPFRTGQSVPIADYTARVAGNMMMPTRIVDFAADDNRLDTSPGVILIDPWVLKHDDGRTIVRAAVEALRQWVTLVVVVDRNDPQYDAASALADDVMRIAGGTGHLLVRGVREFEQQIGTLIKWSRRHYLNRPPDPEGGPR